jgi:ABC-2 type transport system permease protein
VAALAAGAVAFGAMGVAVGALAREVRAASLLAILMALPIAFLALVPAGAVTSSLYDVIRFLSALFPFRAALDAIDGALNAGGPGLGGALAHLAVLTAAYLAIARAALRRFA